MKKICFSDKYGLTEAVLSGRKTQTRRICKHDRPDETYDIAFPIFEDKDFDGEGNPISPLYGAFCWRNEAGDCTEWNVPKYKEGEVVAVAQSYKEADIADCPSPIENIYYEARHLPGWTNKMFVRADLMPHRIRITNVRLEQLQDISDEDCIKEGICKWTKDRELFKYDLYEGTEMFLWSEKPIKPREAYAALIDRIAGKGTWDSNPYVFVYDFELVK